MEWDKIKSAQSAMLAAERPEGHLSHVILWEYCNNRCVLNHDALVHLSNCNDCLSVLGLSVISKSFAHLELRFDDREGTTPIEKTSESGQSKTNRVGGPARFDLSLDIEAELFAQEKIFGCYCSSGLETEMGERKRILENTEQSPNKVQ